MAKIRSISGGFLLLCSKAFSRTIFSIRYLHSSQDAPCLPQKYCASIVIIFSWDSCNTHEKWKTVVKCKIWGGGGQTRRGPANGEFFTLGIRLLVYRVSNHYIALKAVLLQGIYLKKKKPKVVSRYNDFPFENGCEKWHFLVWIAWRTGRHNPNKNSQEYTPDRSSRSVAEQLREGLKRV